MQILFKVKNIKDYVEKEREYKWPVEPCKQCPNCKKYCKFYKHGFYERHFINLHIGINRKICIRRYICTNCLKTVSLLPFVCIKKFVFGFEQIFNIVLSLLKRTSSLEKTIAKINIESKTYCISKQQFYNYLNRFIENSSLIESFLRQSDPKIKFIDSNGPKQERVKGLLESMKNEFHRLDNFLYTFFQATNKSPLTLIK